MKLLLCSFYSMFLWLCWSPDPLHAATAMGASRDSSWRMTDTVYCKKAPQESYALYLPANISDSIRYPLVLFLDPMARGLLPIRLYKDIAKEMGYILACSHQSKNGPSDLSIRSANAILNDLLQLFPIDSNRIFASGFSGSARVIFSFAVYNPLIKGVIGCGAGLQPGVKANQAKTFAWTGVCGNADMNFHECRELAKELSSINPIHYFQSFEGSHQWPPVDYYRNALEWLDISCRKNISNHEQPKYGQHFQHRSEMIFKSIANRDYLGAFSTFSQAKRNMPIESLAGYDSLNLLINSPVFEKEYRKQDNEYWAALRKEQMLRDSIAKGFQGVEWTLYNIRKELKDGSWWNWAHRKIQQLAGSDNREKRLAGERLLNLMEISCYEYYYKYEGNLDWKQAEYITDIFVLFNSSWYPWYLKARMEAIQGNTSDCIRYINKAMDKGLQKEKWISDPLFSRIISEQPDGGETP